MRARGSPLSEAYEAATVWAGTRNGHHGQHWGQHSLLGTQMTAVELDSKSGCLFLAGPGKTPSPSTPAAARAAFCAGLPSAHLKRGFAGDFGKQKLHPPGPGDAGKQPPMV